MTQSIPRRLYSWSHAPELAAKYRALLPRMTDDSTLRDWAANYCEHHAGKCDWDAAFIARHYAPARILNVGAAPFIFEAACRHAGIAADIVSLDLAPERFPHLHDALGVRAVKLDIEAAPNEEVTALGMFDCIVFSEIFEHLRLDLLRTMRRLRELLTPDGRMYLTTPNGASFKALKRHVLQRRSGPDPVGAWSKLERLGHMGHVREYASREVRDVLEHCGFKIEKQLFGYRRGATLESQFKRVLFSVVPGFADMLLIVARRDDCQPGKTVA